MTRFEIPLEYAPQANHGLVRAGRLMLKFGISSPDDDSRSIPGNAGNFQLLLVVGLQVFKRVGKS